ncbi:MAG: NADH-quinone oxidoreductase subunit A [Phycisphaerae bacterium]|nr:NADH-quinone oxidoreductase subunit A [Phycisphaerae bacterium]
MAPTSPMILAELSSYMPVAMLIIMVIIFGVVNLTGTHLLGPTRHGETKEQTYESGMTPIGTARKRFNIRFYILAMTFLVFDVEIIFLYPWAVDFTQLDPLSSDSTLFFGRILFFILTSIVAYVYAWKKGVFRWD